MLVSLIAYVLGAGADFGGGVWDLLARGPDAERQRALVAGAIGPVWEANHVWLVLVVVLLFTCFPPAFAALAIALHVPLALLLVGIVLRGSAFAFRSYGTLTDEVQRRWGRVFAIASLVTPVMLGACVGAVAAGRVGRFDPAPGAWRPYLDVWCAPFPLALGAFTLALFALLAAVYLTLETSDPALRRAFRTRAIVTAVVAGALAYACLGLAAREAPALYAGLTSGHGALALHAGTAVTALGVIVALRLGRDALARLLVIVQVTLVLAGWARAQYPYLLPPALTLRDAAAPRATLDAVMVALAAGALVLFPALAWLLQVFKRGADAFETLHAEDREPGA